ncbi:MAG: tRNA (adenosine(37)-N6)-threonylcarbamoyltransferase complex dimerization subunit type 1 TsaB [Lachnospiraceae bacterium]|nr:tRNA (adenosine(37)-N6)-threonylcarbamoyltransferase complex dimerization subunit type 1 TsaB [Lachnospiraceae bacterium]
MKILALDSSGLVASVAVLDGDVIQSEYTMNYKKTHSQTLLPMLEAVKKLTDLDLSTIDAIAVAAGPGSFTGLRIGSATAKGLGLALNTPIIPVPTLEGLAYIFYGSDKVICPIMDARRNQVYTGLYSFDKNGSIYDMMTIKEQCASDIEDLIKEINKLDRDVIFLGDGVPVFKEIIEEKCRVGFSFAPAHMNRQRAGAVAAYGKVLYEQGKYETAAEHAPEYLRLSQAERERMEGIDSSCISVR